ncbi:MAG: ATP-binding cassette domain-containing protein [Lacunisphaera sp.]
MVAHPNPSIPLLALRRAAKSFGGVRALRGVDFELHAGEVHALLGENGAGKSTLIKIITGAHQPDGGEIVVAGETVASLTPTRAQALGIACIYQQPALFADLTVAENIGLRLEPSGAWRRIDWADRRIRSRELLARVGAAISPEAEVRTLSMPEQQLVEIACAIGSGARIVIMDEPTASLTRQEQERLFTVVREMRAAGDGGHLYFPPPEEITTLADRVTVLRDGESVGTQPIANVTEAGLIKLMVGREVNLLYPPSESAPGEVVLDVRGLGCAAGGVKEVTFQVRAGEVFGLAGLVGAGRTELARTLFGADAGRCGRDSAVGQARDAGLAARGGRAGHRVRARGPAAAWRRAGDADRAEHDDGDPSHVVSRRVAAIWRRAGAGAGLCARPRGEVRRTGRAGGQPERWQPTEGVARALAGDETAASDSRRADAGCGRRREERDSQDRAAAREGGTGGDFDFERSA